VSFLVPGALWVLGLVAVPIVIHLFNRRRFRTVEWAPMEYLRQAFRKHRRRLRLEELLLLLVRTAFVALIALALARPSTSRPGWPWRHLDAPVARVVILDDSLSMGYRSAAGVAFERARHAALTLLEAWPDTDAVVILAATSPERPLSSAGRDLARAAIASAGLSDAACSMGACLAAAGRQLAQATEQTREVVLLTDLRKAGWDAGVAPAAEALARTGARLRVIDVGTESVDDVALVALEARQSAVFPRQPVQMTAKIRNGGQEAFGPASATLRTGTQERSLPIPRIGPGDEAPVTFTVSFDSPGAHPVEVTLPDDPLPADGLRLAVVWVRDALDIVVVDGNPSPQPFEGASDFVAAALGVGDLPVRVRVETDSEWLSRPPEAADLLVLCNLSSMPPAQAGHLESLVRRGMGVIVFPGDQVDPEAWNDRLHRGGRGILPVPISASRDGSFSGLAVMEVEPNPLAALKNVAPGTLSAIRGRRHMPLETAPESPAHVLAAFGGAGGAPAIVEATAGIGRVVVFSTTADRAWSDWPIDPSWVLAVRETAFWAARRGPTGLEREAGPRFDFRPEGRVTAPRLRVLGEDQDRAVEVRDDADGPVLHGGTALRAGAYDLAWTAENGAAIRRTVAVNPAASEASLARWDREGFRRFLGPLETDVLTDADLDAKERETVRELWRTLIWAAVVLFFAEGILTAHLGKAG
jgi:hypothetical protein